MIIISNYTDTDFTCLQQIQPSVHSIKDVSFGVTWVALPIFGYGIVSQHFLIVLDCIASNYILSLYSGGIRLLIFLQRFDDFLNQFINNSKVFLELY